MKRVLAFIITLTGLVSPTIAQTNPPLIDQGNYDGGRSLVDTNSTSASTSTVTTNNISNSTSTATSTSTVNSNSIHHETDTGDAVGNEVW